MRSNRRAHRPVPLGLLHHVAAVLTLAGQGSGEGGGASQRRRRQRLALTRRLLDPLPEGLRAPTRHADQFWVVLRWGGVGLILAWVLQR